MSFAPFCKGAELRERKEAKEKRKTMVQWI